MTKILVKSNTGYKGINPRASGRGKSNTISISKRRNKTVIIKNRKVKVIFLLNLNKIKLY